MFGDTKVVCVDTSRDYAPTAQPSMKIARRFHGAGYHQGALYIIGGQANGMTLTSCEMLSFNENSWKDLPSLPEPSKNLSVVVLEDLHCLYALGGSNFERDIIQSLNFDTLKWEILELRLPFSSCSIVSFKVDESEAFLVAKDSLYVFNPCAMSLLRIATCYIFWNWSRTGLYHDGTLYCQTFNGPAEEIKVGSLTY